MLVSSILNKEYHGTENNDNNKNGKENSLIEYFPCYLFILEKSEIPELWDFFHIPIYHKT